ncbi:L-Proline/Glycine betaine transporter ProP [Rhodococcus wratislaviensis]|uniref:L-Proline/Glycine betaine transporter ProP n=1 Tax=Rhodococcus wratislaviensis TaxID=44752 RepID=A0A402CM14_RHOWR|nr:MFS transporter [Rhodococcus wratislaviensis]GCE44786.1 L-Proline/Glycine betaine transporter ProP [Rhodococcus wratislaviensis]
MALVHARTRRRAFAGALAGHVIEWYDYGVYGFLAVYIAGNFFVSENPSAALLNSLAVFALSFLVRPLGGLVFGPLADRIGRKAVLVSIVGLMSASTFAVGLLPTYERVGIVAPALLVVVRCIQGLSAGGEMGTATSFMAEYAGAVRRGWGTSLVVMGSVIGLLFGSLFANGLAVLVGASAMSEWGWRLPFLLTGPLGVIALIIRAKIEETPEFLELQRDGNLAVSPLREINSNLRPIVIVFAIVTLMNSYFYLVLTFTSTYFTQYLEFGTGARFGLVTAATVVAAIMMPLGGRYTDSHDRRKFLMAAGVLSILSMLWFFWVSPTSTPGQLILPLLAMAATFGLYASSTFALVTEILPVRTRSTGIAIGYNLPVAIFGGSAPLVAAWLIERTGDPSSPMYYFVALGCVSLIGLMVIRDRDYMEAAPRGKAVLLDASGDATP